LVGVAVGVGEKRRKNGKKKKLKTNGCYACVRECSVGYPDFITDKPALYNPVTP
jgi:ferredoxin